jgi:hypothetical protein
MISRSLNRRLENLEYRFEPVGEPAGEPTIINLSFVDRDLKVVNQMQMTIAAPPNDAGWRAHRPIAACETAPSSHDLGPVGQTVLIELLAKSSSAI